ncbi:MmgE/PrpD family protein, partial [Klebsiella pneumoniae]|uniref:MmgE/PrpD family protein n=1 Tax=Klebsiella pneumoniae TaxID=573 RepID=UPI00272F93A3
GSDAAAIALKTVDTAFGGPRSATVIGDKRATSVDAATFVNGVLVRSLDLNDTYLGTEPLHPSELMPTALALCESLGRNGRDFITALAV